MIMDQIEAKNLSEKPGWVRLSLHPIMSTAELVFIINALMEIIQHKDTWSKDYTYNATTNEFDALYEIKSDPNRYKDILSI